ncbi:MAG: helix-turn-helix domain-containing protein [Acidobacteriota bacterium]|nr:helix-turn-helix domain-containing protein [Acidobacteriota bacterium]
MGRIRTAFNRIYNEKKDLRQITQTDIAKSLGCKQGTVSNYLSGSVGMSEEIIDKFCDAMGITLADVALAAGELPSGRNVAPISEEAPKDLRAAVSRMEALYRANPRAFQSVARTIDDWLIDAEEPEEKPARQVS